MARKHLLPVLLRRGVLPAPAAVRPLLDDPLAQSHGRRTAAGAVAGKPGGGDQERSDQAGRPRPPVVDTIVQPKNVTFPTDAKLVNRAREKLVTLAKKLGVELRQSYTRVGKLALVKHQRYAHARQFGRARKALRKLKTYLGRVIRDIARKIDGAPALETAFARLMSLARRVRDQERASAAPRSTACTRPRSSASARANRTSPTSSASR